MGTETKESKNGLMGDLSYMVIFIILTTLDLLVEGFVLSYLWAWFFVPILNLPLLSLKQAIGISMTVAFLTKKFSTAKDEEDEIKLLKKALKAAFVFPFLTLAIGYIVHLMM